MRVSLVVSICFLCSVPASGDVILTNFGSGTPVDSWAYSKAVGVGKGNSITYVPQLSDAAGLSFLGYVFYPASTGWLNTDSSFYNEDSIRVFRTYLRSDVDQTLALLVGGDDGHSIYVNDVFADGDGFGTDSLASITLTAGVVTKLEVLGYNGPGPSNVYVFNNDTSQPIESTPGLEIHAEGDFSAVPEPAVWPIMSIVALTGWIVRKRRRKTEACA